MSDNSAYMEGESVELRITAHLGSRLGSIGTLFLSDTIDLGPVTFEQAGRIFGALHGWGKDIQQRVVDARPDS